MRFESCLSLNAKRIVCGGRESFADFVTGWRDRSCDQDMQTVVAMIRYEEEAARIT